MSLTSIAQAVSDHCQEAIGHPATLIRALKLHLELSSHFSEPITSAHAAAVIRWDMWNVVGHLPAGTARLYSAEYSDQPTTVQMPELLEFTAVSQEANWTCDIRDVDGLHASTADIADYDSLDAFMEGGPQDLLQEINDAGLQTNLAHDQIRILRSNPERQGDFFAQFVWQSDRIYLINDGGSHHFGAARYIAGKIGKKVPLTGVRRIYRIRPQAVSSLVDRYDIYALPYGSGYDAFHDVMKRIGATYATYPMPVHHDATLLVFLPTAKRRSVRASAALRNAGVFDMGRYWLKIVERQAYFLEK